MESKGISATVDKSVLQETSSLGIKLGELKGIGNTMKHKLDELHRQFSAIDGNPSGGDKSSPEEAIQPSLPHMLNSIMGELQECNDRVDRLATRLNETVGV